jgi:Cellulase (glycosyl hydrolase family 5)
MSINENPRSAFRWAYLIGAAALIVVYFAASRPAGATGDISVENTTILRDGHPWVAKGVTLVGRVSPAGLAMTPDFQEARNSFGPDELSRAKAFGVDLIRFQISQGGTDPQSRIYSPAYIKEVQASVKLARDMGFSVIVSLQAEKTSGLDELGMPGQKALRAWGTLAPLFANDRGIMLELFNEPSPNGPDTTPSHDWESWKNGMQPLVDEIRHLQARNVLIADGLFWSKVLKGAPSLNDPISPVVYAVHPYYSKYLRDRADWDENFGNFAATHPVIATEWNAGSDKKNCTPGTPLFAASMLEYLRQRKIGLVAWAFDFPNSIIQSPGGTPTNFNGFSECEKGTHKGAGELIYRQFNP